MNMSNTGDSIVIHLVVKYTPCYEFSSWGVVGVCTDHDSAIRLATRTALSDIDIEFYDPKRRFQYNNTYGVFDDRWFKYTGASNYWIETWSPGEQKNEPNHKTTIYFDAAIKNWIVQCASSADNTLKVLDAWKQGKRIDVLVPFIDLANSDTWRDSRTSHPLGSVGQFEWEKRFGKSGGVEFALHTNCSVENNGVRLVVVFGTSEKVSTSSEETDIVPGLTMKVTYDDANRIQSITLRYTSLDDAKLAPGVVRNEHPLHWEYEPPGEGNSEGGDILTIYVSDGVMPSSRGDENVSTSIPSISAVFRVVHRSVEPYSTANTLRTLCIKAPTQHLVDVEPLCDVRANATS